MLLDGTSPGRAVNSYPTQPAERDIFLAAGKAVNRRLADATEQALEAWVVLSIQARSSAARIPVPRLV
jgi:hypothetical protein